MSEKLQRTNVCFEASFSERRSVWPSSLHFSLKFLVDLEFPLYHASDNAFGAIGLVASKEISKVLSTSDQQERNKVKCCVRNRFADSYTCAICIRAAH